MKEPIKELEIKTKKVKLKDIKQYKNNPRLNDNAVEIVKKSIEKYGYKVPIILDKNNIIIAGETRYKSLKADKRVNDNTIITVIDASDLDETNAKAFRIADNKSHEFALWDHEFALWDHELLELEFKDLKELDFDLLDTFFNEKEIEKVISDSETKEFTFEDFIFENAKLPCWFVIRSDLTNYLEIKAQIEKIKDILNTIIEDSIDGTY